MCSLDYSVTGEFFKVNIDAGILLLFVFDLRLLTDVELKQAQYMVLLDVTLLSMDWTECEYFVIVRVFYSIYFTI